MPSTRAVRPILIAAAVLLVASALPLTWTGLVAHPRAAAATAATTTDALNLRDGPGLGYAVLLVMPVGASVTVTGDPQAGFYPVSYNGSQGWASGDYLSPSGWTGSGTGSATTTDSLNLRTAPSLDATILLVMPPGASVTLTGGESGQFIAISYNGRQGWASRDYLRIGSNDRSGGGAPTGGTATVLEDLNLRAEPSLGAAVLLVMPTGAAVGLTGERTAGFAEVVYNGRRGWAFSTYLDDGGAGPSPGVALPNPSELTPPAPGSGTAIVTEDLTLRSAASSGAAVRTVMPTGAAVTLTGVAQNGYYLVLYQGQRGWASSTYLLTGGRPQDQYGYSQELIESFIVQAARRYGQDPDDMLRVARCESNLVATAVNPAGSYGIFQFVRSTWESTPYADNDVFEAWANANAAAWMWSAGRRGEWVCK